MLEALGCMHHEDFEKKVNNIVLDMFINYWSEITKRTSILKKYRTRIHRPFN